ncbi:S41 family peptidase [Croceibacterium ferulae]|uniref:S41 family peptidase n=1 Tax=Croceibacterium ferulae TaxID=1854641 RepID=UPI000EAFB86A|nr:S41 family peptidase [Croceibacterium ferulae]
MRRIGLTPALCAIAAMLTACGGDDAGSSGAISSGGSSPVPGATPTPAPSTAACSLESRQAWARDTLNEWYLFPENIAAGVQPASYSTVDAYIDALVAPARALGRDRYFTYLTSIVEENAYYEQGTSAGFGFRLVYDEAARRVFVSESFEGAPALAAGIDRGAEILAIDGRTVSSLFASGGAFAVYTALGSSGAGGATTLTVRDASSERVIQLARRDFALDPVSDRYGTKVFTSGGQRVGYINLRTFIDTAEPDLAAAFAGFRAEGITQLIVDLRYNGGGLIRTAQALGNLMAADRAGQLFGEITFRPSKAADNERFTFQPPAQAIAATRVAFIATQDSASASELLINAFTPYLGPNMALVGSNTYGKPVGQIAVDRPECDDRLRVVALRTVNAAGQGDYYRGLAATVPVTCAASDDLTRPLGDPAEGMIATALQWLGGGTCTPISATATASASVARTGTPAKRRLLQPAQPANTVERELPGAF